MILYLHHLFRSYPQHEIIEGKCRYVPEKDCLKVTGITGIDEDMRWHSLFVMDLETGEILSKNNTKPAPWVHDPLLRALKVVEFLEKERKKK